MFGRLPFRKCPQESEFIWPMGMAFVYTNLGEENTALDYLERSYEERVGWMSLLAREPALAPLRKSPRFQALVRKIGPDRSNQ